MVLRVHRPAPACAAFETFALQKNDEGMKATAKKYPTFTDRAKAADDPIYAALSPTWNRQAILYRRKLRTLGTTQSLIANRESTHPIVSLYSGQVPVSR